MTTDITSKQTDSLRQLPPYVFAELDRLKAEARMTRAELLDLGIGSPDLPMAPGIIEALSAAAHQGTAHGYPPFRGVPSYFESIGRFMQSRFGVDADTEREMVALSGAKEGLAQLVTATCGPGDICSSRKSITRCTREPRGSAVPRFRGCRCARATTFNSISTRFRTLMRVAQSCSS